MKNHIEEISEKVAKELELPLVIVGSSRTGAHSYFDPEYSKEIVKVMKEPWFKKKRKRTRHCYKKYSNHVPR